MDFETRQRLCVEEINNVMKKFNVALQAYLIIQAQGIVPQVRLVDVEQKPETTDTVDTKAQNEDKKSKKKGK